MEEGTSKAEAQLLQLKLQFMREWTTVFFHETHRSVMNILCGLRKDFQRIDKNNPNFCLKDIKDIDDLLSELRNGKLLIIEEVRAAKGEKRTQFIQLDFNFFNIYSTLANAILEEIRPKLEDFKKFKSGEAKKVCRNCGTEKTESELTFLGMKCNCTNTNFVSVEPNKKEIQRLQFIKGVLEKRFLNKKRAIDELDRKLSQNNMKRKKKEEDKQANQFQQFCQKHALVVLKSDNHNKNVSRQERHRADKLYGRTSQFCFVEQLNQIREYRSRNQGNLKMEEENLKLQ